MLRPRFSAVLILALLGASALTSPAEAQPAADEVVPLLGEMTDQVEAALTVSQDAEEASSVAEVKAAADSVFRTVWGVPSGQASINSHGAVAKHGWKTRWQTTEAEFDSAFAARMGVAPPDVDDPRKLGVMGRGRYVRKHFAVASDSAGPETPGARFSHDEIVAPLSNVIGWMRMDNGITKGELQPRVDLTYRWDAPMSFWQSTADTGWLHEAFAQAQNILKTDYDGDTELARSHVRGLTALLEKALNGIDANGNGTVEAKVQEGGLRVALEHARRADLAAR